MRSQAQIAAENLLVTKLALDALGIPFCLFLGSALGAWRDHDFCPGDIDDIDIAVHADHYARRDDICIAMKACGFAVHEYRDENALAHEIAFQKKYNDESGKWRSKVDIFFIKPHKNGFAWTFYDTPVQNKWLPNFFMYFDRTYFKHLPGVLFNVPCHIEDYLLANYGEHWRTPVHRDQWDWRTHNHATRL